MSVTITIRDIPQVTRDELAGRAARSGRSLQEYLRGHLIDFADHVDADDLLRQIRQRKAATGSTVSGGWIVETLRADRDR